MMPRRFSAALAKAGIRFGRLQAGSLSVRRLKSVSYTHLDVYKRQVQGLSEGVHFAKRAGLDVETMLEVISKGAAGSWQMENRGKTMNQNKFDLGFAVDWMRKDLGIVLAAARRNGAQLPVTALVDQFYAEVQKMGGNRWDTSSLIARLEG